MPVILRMFFTINWSPDGIASEAVYFGYTYINEMEQGYNGGVPGYVVRKRFEGSPPERKVCAMMILAVKTSSSENAWNCWG